MELAVALTTNAENLQVGDLMLENADFKVLTNIREEVRQRIIVCLSFFRGEYFLNLNEGTPWFTTLGEKGAEEDLRVLVTQVVSQVDGVASVESCVVTPGERRQYAVDFSARTIDGDVVTFNSFVVGS
jgi:hypothetical protein